MIAYSVVYDRTDLMELQLKCLRKFCSGIQELVIVNNGPDFDSISKESYRLGLRCFNHTRLYYNPSNHHAGALNHIWQNEARHSADQSLFLDMDIFPVRNTSPELLLEGCTLSGVVQIKGDVRYPWPGMLSVAPNPPAPTLLKFDCGEGMDSGGGLARYMRETGATCNWIPEVQCEPGGIFTNIIARDWAHFRDVSNWQRKPQEVVNRRVELLRDYLLGILYNSPPLNESGR